MEDLQFIYNDAGIDTLLQGFIDFIDPSAELTGDFNGDNIVNLADYTVWRDNLGAVSDSVINNTGDGVEGVTTADYAEWKTSFGVSGPAAGILAATSAVPEPTAGVIALIAALSLVTCRLRK